MLLFVGSLVMVPPSPPVPPPVCGGLTVITFVASPAVAGAVGCGQPDLVGPGLCVRVGRVGTGAVRRVVTKYPGVLTGGPGGCVARLGTEVDEVTDLDARAAGRDRDIGGSAIEDRRFRTADRRCSRCSRSLPGSSCSDCRGSPGRLRCAQNAAPRPASPGASVVWAIERVVLGECVIPECDVRHAATRRCTGWRDRPCNRRPGRSSRSSRGTARRSCPHSRCEAGSCRLRVYVSVPLTNVLMPGFVLSIVVDWQTLLVNW